MWFVLFFVLPFVGLAYVLWHVWCLLPLGTGGKNAVVAVCVLAFSTLFLNFSHAIDRFPMWFARVCYEVGNTSVFVLLYLVLLFLLMDLGRLLHIVPKTVLYANWYTAAAVTVLMVAVFAAGYANYMHKARHSVALPTAKTAAKGVKPVMITDLPLGHPHNSKHCTTSV